MILYPFFATLLLGILTPLIAYFLASKIGKLDSINACALAAHFGSVSAVTFMAAINFADSSSIPYERFVTALLVVLEIPGIVVALTLAGLINQSRQIHILEVITEAVTGKSVILLTGGLFVGLFAERTGVEAISSVFVTPFHGVLSFFLLEMGVVAASRLKDVKSSLKFMLTYGTVVPLLFAVLGIIAGKLAGLSIGGTAILATMAASASYIAAPAAVRMAIPDANPAIYLTTSISITLPFNIAIGIPLYFMIVKMVS
jgi:hypothetical protein